MAAHEFVRLDAYLELSGEADADARSERERNPAQVVRRGRRGAGARASGEPRRVDPAGASTSRPSRRTSTSATTSSWSTPRRSTSPDASCTTSCTAGTPATSAGLREVRAETMLKTHPERVIEWAVQGMLPKNRLGTGHGEEAEGLPGRRASAPGPAASGRCTIAGGGPVMAAVLDRFYGDRSAQDVRGARVDPARPGPDRRQPAGLRGLLPARDAAHDHRAALRGHEHRRASSTCS